MAAAPQLLALLPWGRPFERDAFIRPDFSALEVLAFASSGIPAGINVRSGLWPPSGPLYTPRPHAVALWDLPDSLLPPTLLDS